jgi:hypothetical protein
MLLMMALLMGVGELGPDMGSAEEVVVVVWRIIEREGARAGSKQSLSSAPFTPKRRFGAARRCDLY